MNDEVDRVRTVYAGYEHDRQQRWASDHAILDERAHLLTRTVDRVLHNGHRNDGPTVLDLGCGKGDLHNDLVSAGIPADRITGVDVIRDRLLQARGRGLPVALASGSALPFRTESFDLVVAFTVLSSIHDDAVLRGIESEVRRVLRPAGSLIIYDMRLPSPTNRSIRPITRRRLDQLFPDWASATRSCTLLPPLSRRIAPQPGPRYDALARIPFLRSHTISVLRPPSPASRRPS